MLPSLTVRLADTLTVRNHSKSRLMIVRRIRNEESEDHERNFSSTEIFAQKLQSERTEQFTTYRTVGNHSRRRGRHPFAVDDPHHHRGQSPQAIRARDWRPDPFG